MGRTIKGTTLAYVWVAGGCAREAHFSRAEEPLARQSARPGAAPNLSALFKASRDLSEDGVVFRVFYLDVTFELAPGPVWVLLHCIELLPAVRALVVSSPTAVLKNCSQA